MKKASDIMTTEVITVTPETNVTELASMLTANNISGVVVINRQGTAIGVVTESDLIDQQKKLHIPTVITILDSVIYLENPDRLEQEIKKIAGSTVGDIYSRNPITVTSQTTLDELATIMSEKNIHTLPVVEGDNLVGVIGKKDIIKTLIS